MRRPRTKTSLALLLALALLPWSGLLGGGLAELRGLDDSAFLVRYGQLSRVFGGVIGKGKQPSSGLVVNVPSGQARVGLLAPEVTFAGESLASVRSRLVGGMATFTQTAMGTHVANASYLSKSSSYLPVSLLCTDQNTSRDSQVRIDLPKGFDLGLFVLVTSDHVRIPFLLDTQAFYLDIPMLIQLRSLGLERLEMTFYCRLTMKSYKLSFEQLQGRQAGLLKF
jgi:hypothetical protein